MAIIATLAGAGGLARFLVGRLDTNAMPLTKSKFIFQLSANVFVSGFAGTMGALMMSEVTPVLTWQFASAGVFGFMGARALEMLADKINSKI